MNALLKTAKMVVMAGFLAVVAMPVWADLIIEDSDGTVLRASENSVSNVPNVSFLFAGCPNAQVIDGTEHGKLTEQLLNYMAQPALTWPHLVNNIAQATKESADHNTCIEGSVMPSFVLANPKMQNKVALVIGNNGTKDFPMSGNAIKDANAVGAKFKNLGYDTLIVTNATLEEMEKSITIFQKKLQKGSVGVFYFSGHNVYHGNEDYLLAMDSRIKNWDEARQTTVSLRQIQARFQTTSADTLLFILDTPRRDYFSR